VGLRPAASRASLEALQNLDRSAIFWRSQKAQDRADLIIAAAAGVQLLAHRASQLDQASLNREVTSSASRPGLKAAAGRLGPHRLTRRIRPSSSAS